MKEVNVWSKMSGASGALVLLWVQHMASGYGLAAGAPSSTNHDIQARASGGRPMTLMKLDCIMMQCRGRTGSALDLCTRTCADPVPRRRSSPPCQAAQCHKYTGVYRELCEFTKCTLEKVDASATLPPLGPLAAKRYNFDDIMWPDEFETRSTEDNEHAREDHVRTRRMLSAEASLSRERKDLEEGRPLKSQGCSSICHGFTGKQYDRCVQSQCKAEKPITLKKRWSTRLCMEAHCQGAGNKVEYFMCGKVHCH